MNLSEFFHLHKSKTVRNTAIVFSGNVAAAVISAVITILLARVLGPKEFGILSFFIAVSVLVTNISGFGINTALVRFFPLYYKKNKNLANLILKVSLKIKIVLALAASILGLILSKQIATRIFNNPELILPLKFAFLFVIGSSLYEFILSVLQAKQQFKKTVFLGFTNQLIKLVLILFLLLVYKLSLFNVLTVFIIMPIVGILLGSLLMPKNFLKAKGNEKKVIKDLFNFSKWIILAIIFVSIYNRLAVLMLTYFHNIELVGYYSVADGLASKLMLLIASIAFVLLPRFSKISKKHELKKYIKKSIKITVLISILLLPIIFFAKPIILLLFGLQFSESVILFKILYINYLILLAFDHLHVIFYTADKPQILALITFITLLFNFSINLILIPVYGAIGAAVTVLLTTIFYTIMKLIYLYFKL